MCWWFVTRPLATRRTSSCPFDPVVVLTKQGRIVQLKFDWPNCCMSAPLEILVTIAAQSPSSQRSSCGRLACRWKEELHGLRLDEEGLEQMPMYLKQQRFKIMCIIVPLFVWIYSLLPHDDRDKHRRRHMTREVAANQFCIYGCACRRRSSMKLFFGKYPPQAVLNLAGSLGNVACCTVVNPSDQTNNGLASPSKVMLVLMLFIS